MVKFDGKCLVIITEDAKFKLCVDGSVYSVGKSTRIYENVSGLFTGLILFLDKLLTKNKPVEEGLYTLAVFVGRFLRVDLGSTIELVHRAGKVTLESIMLPNEVELELRTPIGIFKEKIPKAFYFDNIDWLYKRHKFEIRRYEFKIDGVDFVAFDAYGNELVRIGPYKCFVRDYISAKFEKPMGEKWLTNVAEFGVEKDLDVEIKDDGYIVKIGNFRFFYKKGVVEKIEYECGSLKGYGMYVAGLMYFKGRGIELDFRMPEPSELGRQLGQILERFMRYIEF